MTHARQKASVSRPSVRRRTLLAAVGILPALSIAADAPPRGLALSMVNVRDHGATGDGFTDDSAAIGRAVSALHSGTVLYFPSGSYRFCEQRPRQYAAIMISGLSRVAVVFAAGAELVMDNLDGNGLGTTHGCAVHGACSDILLQDVRVRWKERPSDRSQGDAIRVLGYPSDGSPPAGWAATTGAVRNIRIVGCSARQAPQTGCILMGCSDVTVQDFTAEDTLADGLHLNACRRVAVDGCTAVRTGDDGLAFVTYQDDRASWQSPTGPFNRSTLDDWCNSASSARRVSVQDGAANGCRIAGATDVTVDGLAVDGKADAGVIVDSAMVGPNNDWTYLASRAVQVRNAAVRNCSIGVRLVSQNVSSRADSAFWTFDVHFAGIEIDDAKVYSLRTEGNGTALGAVSGGTFEDVTVRSSLPTGGGAVALSALRDATIRRLTMTTVGGAPMTFSGQDVMPGGPAGDTSRSNVVISDVRNTGGGIVFQDMRGLRVDGATSGLAPGDGVTFARVVDGQVDDIEVLMPDRTASGVVRGVFFRQVSSVAVRGLTVETDVPVSTAWRSLEIGGGDPSVPAASGLTIEGFTYTSAIDGADSGVILQSGPFGAENSSVRGRFFAGGEPDPVWRSVDVASGR